MPGCKAYRRAVSSLPSLLVLLLSQQLSGMVEASLKPSTALPVMLLLPTLPGPQLGRSEHSGSEREDNVSPADSYPLVDSEGLLAGWLLGSTPPQELFARGESGNLASGT